jgi:hypothetical protein
LQAYGVEIVPFIENGSLTTVHEATLPAFDTAPALLAPDASQLE